MRWAGRSEGPPHTQERNSTSFKRIAKRSVTFSSRLAGDRRLTLAGTFVLHNVCAAYHHNASAKVELISRDGVCAETPGASFHSQHYLLWLGLTPHAGVPKARRSAKSSCEDRTAGLRLPFFLPWISPKRIKNHTGYT